MTAQGKITASEITKRPRNTVRVLITDSPANTPTSDQAGPDTEWQPAINKRGMTVALVTDFQVVGASGYHRRSRYTFTTDKGTVADVAPSQTFWLAPDPGTATDQMAGAAGDTDGERAADDLAQFQAGAERLGYTAAEPPTLRWAPNHWQEDTDAGAQGIPLAMCHVRKGDVITLPGETERRTVDSAWWIMRETSHGLRLTDGEQNTYKRDGAPDVVLHERPGYGPFDAVYEVGDRVTAYFNTTEDIGEVTAVIRYGDDVCYEVHRVVGGAGAVVGPENMRREITPEIGQRWVMPEMGITFTVTGFDNGTTPGRLVVQGERPGHRVALGGPEWALIVSGPHAASPSVRRCDVGGEQLDGAWWLLRSVARGWEADHGAACATHAGQDEPEPGAVFQPCPTGYGAAVEAQTERIGEQLDLDALLGAEVPVVDMPVPASRAAIDAYRPASDRLPVSRMYGAEEHVEPNPASMLWASPVVSGTALMAHASEAALASARPLLPATVERIERAARQFADQVGE